MMIANGDGTYTSGPLDALMILQHESTLRFHVAFFEEHTFPGPIQPVSEVPFVRLISKMHHTEGAATMDEALVQRAEMLEKLQVPAANLFDDPVAWDGHLGVVLILPNWLKESPSLVLN
jgi:hypothetical protein